MPRTRIPLNNVAGAARDLRDRLDMSTAEIGLSVRTTNCLEERGIFTVNDLLHSTRDDLLSISNFGEKTLEEVYQALEKIGFFRPSRRESGGLNETRRNRKRAESLGCAEFAAISLRGYGCRRPNRPASRRRTCRAGTGQSRRAFRRCR